MTVFSTLLLSAALIPTIFAGTQVTDLGRSNGWDDSVYCDEDYLDYWNFETDDMEVKGRYRNGGQEQIGTCMYGEYGAKNHWIERTFATDFAKYSVEIAARVWSFCEAEAGEIYYVHLNYGGIEEEVYSIDRDVDYSCNGWDNHIPEDYNTWYNDNDVQCPMYTENLYTCYKDIVTDPILIDGEDEFTIRFGSVFNSDYVNEAWAVSDIKIAVSEVNPPPPEGEYCCEGDATWNTHLPEDKWGRCSKLHEKRNCLNKGCGWKDTEYCSVRCCRHSDPGDYPSVRKKCKNHNYDLDNLCLQEPNDRCYVSLCDPIGFRDGWEDQSQVKA